MTMTRANATVADRAVDAPPVEYMLSTIDNPYNPFTQYDEWFAWDAAAGYHSPGLLARIVVTSSDQSEADQVLDINDAIDEICRENVLGVSIKVARP